MHASSSGRRLAAGVIFFAWATGALAGERTLPEVLFFVRTDCPIANRYAPLMQRLGNTWTARGFGFRLVYPDPGDDEGDIERHRREHSLTLPWVRDLDHTWVRRCSVQVTPEVAILSAEGELLYHGRIDDRWAALGKSRPRPQHHDLEENLQALSRGEKILVPSRKAVGCPILSRAR